MLLMVVVGTFLLVALAVARATLLVTSDRIMLAFRRWIIRKTGDESVWTYLVHCQRCTSIWIALPAAILWGTLTLPLHWWWLMAPAWFALSYITVLLGRLEESE